MGIYVADQTLDFLRALMLGAVMGVLYDLFRILRIAIPTRPGVVFAQDVVFFLLCAATTFVFLLSNIDGVVRAFLLIGLLLGWVLYYFTLGQLVMKVSKAIIQAVKAVIGFLFRYLVLPIWRVIYTIIAFILRPLRFFGNFVKKIVQRCRFRLKVGRIVLYNHCKGYFKKRKSTKKSRESTNGEKEEGP